MRNINKLGRFLFAIPFAAFGLMHLTNAGQMAGMVPGFIPGGVLWVYLTGLGMLAASVSFFIRKQVGLAGQALAGLLILFVATIHIPGLIGGNSMSMVAVLKDLSLAGGSLIMAQAYGEDE